MNTEVEKILPNNAEYFSIILLILPITLLLGSAIINATIILINFLFLYHLYKNKNIGFLKDNTFLLLIIFWVYLLLNSFVSIDRSLSFERSIGFIRFIIFAFAIKYFFSISNKKIIKLIFLTWLITFIIVSLDLAYEVWRGHNLLGFKSLYPGRLAGFLNDELVIGNFFVGLSFIILFILKKYFVKNNFLLISILIIFFLSSFLIGERANFTKFLIMMGIITFISIDIKFYYKILIFIIALSAILIIFSHSEKIESRFVRQAKQIYTSGYSNFMKENTHGAHRNAAYQIFKDYNLFGSGLKTFRIASSKPKYENEKYTKTHLRSSTHPHQIHWELLSELGLIGYTLFFVTFIKIFYNYLVRYLKNKNINFIFIPSILYLFVNILPIIPSGSFFTTFNGTIFWINFGLMMCTIKK